MRRELRGLLSSLGLEQVSLGMRKRVDWLKGKRQLDAVPVVVRFPKGVLDYRFREEMGLVLKAVHMRQFKWEPRSPLPFSASCLHDRVSCSYFVRIRIDLW